MKRTYVTPHMDCEAFAANEYVAACYGYAIASSKEDPNRTYVECDQVAHPEKVFFYYGPDGSVHVCCDDPKYAYDSVVIYVDNNRTAKLDDDVAHWMTVRGVNASVNGITASTDHYSGIPVTTGVNRS